MSQTDIPAIKRQLKIKTGVVKRLSKELVMYQKEAEEQFKTVENLKAARANDEDDAKIRSAEKVLQEANKMLPDSQGRLSKAVLDLREFTISASEYTELNEDVDLIAAKETLEVVEM